jgi:hypothetical protein
MSFFVSLISSSTGQTEHRIPPHRQCFNVGSNSLNICKMMTPGLRMFNQNWIAKADNYEDNTLANHFDKFASLYVAFNSLYMQVMTELVISGHVIPKDFKDKKAATDYVVQYLGSVHYINTLLNDQQSVQDFQTICDIIDQENFHIILDWGQPQRASDLGLLGELRNPSRQARAKAILSVFYHIRCNMFHGHKGFENRQRELLVPVNRLLRKTTQIVFDKLDTP